MPVKLYNKKKIQILTTTATTTITATVFTILTVIPNK